MARIRSNFVCKDCNAAHLQWNGRCSACGSWNTLQEQAVVESTSARRAIERRSKSEVSVFDSLEMARDNSVPVIDSTGSFEFDRALGGGLIAGSVTLVGGEPGIGKSTLLSQLVGSYAARSLRCLYVSAEESGDQVAQRVRRVTGGRDSVGILTSNSVEEIESQVRNYAPRLVIIDSIQTISDEEVGSSAGSVNQVRECASRLSDLAKSQGIALVLVGHVTKDGNLAGPRVLEHLVDTVAYFEGERDSSLRTLRVIKHRFGPVGELGMFEMGESGLVDVMNASGFHLFDRVEGQAGSVVFPALDGRRVMLSEIQALVVPSVSEQPRRVVTGFEFNRVLLLMAVLEKKIGIRLHNKDVFLSVAGGARIVDPAADLAVVASVVSSLTDTAVDANTVLVGEIGLGGELRSASNLKQRLTEAGRLGFSKSVVGVNFIENVAGMSISRSADVRSALLALRLPLSKGTGR